MKKLDFNRGWTFKRLEESGDGVSVTLPHDAMCREHRSEESRGRHNIGWFESYDYSYTKRFHVPEDYADKEVLLEFEGVYHNAEVFINKKRAAYRPYGYANFYVNTRGFLKPGEDNCIRVIARNADQPNSRWYSGSGIYRPVYLYVGDKAHIPANGVKIRTLSIQPARVAVDISTSIPVSVRLEITDEQGGTAALGKGETRLEAGGTYAHTTIETQVTDARLWSCEDPYLYTCTVTVLSDEVTAVQPLHMDSPESNGNPCMDPQSGAGRSGGDCVQERFGIRSLDWGPQNGLEINGKRVIIRGACIHHDNGVLGACAFPEAEERKIRILKENGYNAVRSAHNPCSKALLDACDRLGMLVMDEYVDVWYIHKTEYDYAGYMQEWWRQDLSDMVEKDYNHPSVILYSTGNEVSETAQKKGIDLTGQMTQYLHGLDETRPVSCGINIFFNLLSSIGFGVYSDEKARKEADRAQKEAGAARNGTPKKKKAVGSEFYNTLAGLLGDKAMKVGATLYPCDLKTRDAYANMDVSGYNYGIYRYKHDLRKYPDRLILGSETFCKDAYAFWELAKKHPRLVGDFVWAGMDYIGEAGIGAWEYEDYAPEEANPAGWLTAGSGRINILGFPNAEAAYTRVAFEQTLQPMLAVKPVYQNGAHSPSAWKMTDALTSWSWRGCDGKAAAVEVYARADQVELFVNGQSAGRKKMRNTCNVTFHTVYHDGEVTAVAYDAAGKETGRTSLHTAGSETILKVQPEEKELRAGGLGFIQLRYTDADGIWKPMEKHRIRVTVENGTLLGLGNACAYNPDGYWKDWTRTYYGEALAAVRADKKGPVRVTVSDEEREVTLEIPVSDESDNCSIRSAQIL